MKRLKFSLASLTCALSLVALAVPHCAVAQTPTQTDIGNLGGGSANANAVAPGYVVGSSKTGTAVDAFGNQVGHAYVWSASTHTMLDIGALLPNAGASVATSVNSHGEVVGLYYAPDYTTATGFYWSEATGGVTIGAVSGNNGGSMLINENGVVASVAPDGNVFRWTRSGQTGVIQNVGATGNSNAYVTGINSHGDIVGHIDGGAFSFIAWGASSSLTMLHSPSPDWPYNPPPRAEINGAGPTIKITGINDNGVVVGTYWDFEYIYSGYDISQGGFFNAGVHNFHAFKWTSAGGFTDLGNFGVSYLTPGSPATFGAFANAINNSGKIVGYSYLPTTGNAWGYDPFVYDGGLTRLPGLYPGDDRASATGINDDGVVVGYANSTGAAVLWNHGVLTDITPSFAPQFPGAPLIKGPRIAGNGLDRNWNGHAWTMALASTAPADTTPPVLTLPVNIVAEATSAAGATVTFSASAQDDVDGTVPVTLNPPSGSTFPIGMTTVNASAHDAAGNTATGSFKVTVRDTTAPVITSLTPSSATLWPPNHQLVAITLSAAASDAVGVTSLKIISATSNEPDNGLGDGDTANDIVITGNLTLNLRAERSGTGNGRTYTITVEARDDAGNASTKTVTVSVPKSQGK